MLHLEVKLKEAKLDWCVFGLQFHTDGKNNLFKRKKCTIYKIVNFSDAKKQEAKQQEKSFLRLVLGLKTIKQGNIDASLESMQQGKCSYWF